MKHCKACIAAWVLSLALIMVGCALMEEPKTKSAPLGLITTPSAYYSTPKARYLGQKYKANLDRLVERIIRNQKTANLQFANNIASVGGIGFYTHSAATIPDERYLEVVLAAPDAFEISGEYSAKVNRLFELYGIELLSILASDSEIYGEKEVSGYGLNISWRKITNEPTGPRVTLEKAVAYFPKQMVRGFLRQEVSRNDLLRDAFIYAVEEDGPMSLVSYRLQDLKPDSRPPIQEETLTGLKIEPKSEKFSPSQPPTSREARVGIEDRSEDMPAVQAALVENLSPVIQPLSVQEGKDLKTSGSAPERATFSAVPTAKSTAEKTGQKVAIDKPVTETSLLTPKASNESPGQSAQASPLIVEPASTVPLPVAKPVEMIPSVPSPSQTPKERVVPEIAANPPAEAHKRTDEIVTKSDSSAPPTARMQATREEQVRETNVAQQVTDPAVKAADQFQDFAERKSESVVATPKTGGKGLAAAQIAASKVSAAKEDSIGVAKSEIPVLGKTEPPKPFDQPKAIEEKRPEVVITVPKPEVKAPALIEPTLTKQENLSESEWQSAVANKGETLRTPDQPKPVEDRELEVNLNPKAEVKVPAIAQMTMDSPVAKTEAPRELDKPKVTAESKSEVAVAVPKREPESQPIPAPAEPAPVNEVNQTAVVTNVENKKASDHPKPVQEKKPDITLLTPKVDVQTRETKPREEARITQKEPDLSSRPQSVEERPAFASTKMEVKMPQVRPAPPEFAPAEVEKDQKNPPNERIALLSKKTIEAVPEKKPLAHPGPKPLEGYIVQLSFSAKGEAQRWAEKLTERGFVVSMTEAGSGGVFRVRIGNFPGRNEAERQLKALAQDGLKGIVLNLPQAYRPEVSPAAEAVGQTISGTQ